ncbi:hypothetical protein [Stenotrophomonas terrae]|uniref:hypothetical protein n=1 Tax=Stenotrophomonas terrae TaxID=405446 RepID=UPI001379A331|nr:hypothetical protein [Stenotrophomonas terrae]
MQKRTLAAIFLALSAGGLFAAECVTHSLPPFRITVTLNDIAKAGTPLKAFLRNLDSAGENLVGKSTWRERAFVGYVTVVHKRLTMTGTNIQYVEKPCGESAEESGGTGAIAQGPPSGGGTGGGGTGGGIGGWNPPGGCVGNCQPPYGEVGEVQQM